MKWSRVTLVVAPVFAALIAYSHPALAYVDPGSGSVLLQLLFGGVAGAMALLKLFWEPIAGRLRSILNRLRVLFRLKA